MSNPKDRIEQDETTARKLDTEAEGSMCGAGLMVEPLSPEITGKLAATSDLVVAQSLYATIKKYQFLDMNPEELVKGIALVVNDIRTAERSKSNG